MLAEDAERCLFCYANAEIRKEDQNHEIHRFLTFREKRTGTSPEQLVSDSKLTTYANLDTLTKEGIRFLSRRNEGQLYDRA